MQAKAQVLLVRIMLASDHSVGINIQTEDFVFSTLTNHKLYVL